ncbi:hypothetical protein K8354_15370 [Polaribacter litorisediminis]|uniref:hypothetical protein n=1 Tax=Polaribacter litorisediminis TaxID=1908341 RepID=UPI001CBFABAA|nr:hypothetical protein [Polaribacter litorisediminis]UAM97663.1 hypothetical protein K8354_15370 [Polaribacter litorisediminis]
MELTKEQLLQIHNYIYVCGIKHYDVRTEIVDHFANILEPKLDENPDLHFKKEIENIHRNFSDRGFSKLLEEKTKSVTKKFYKQSLHHLTTFFKLPKIIITVGLFFVLFQIMSLFKDTKTFFDVLITILIFSYLLNISVIFYRKKNKKESFLVLDKSNHFNVVALNLYQLFHLGNSFRSKESFLNADYNNIQLAIFVMILLFFWSGEYVYYQNKKLVKEQYPNIIV